MDTTNTPADAGLLKGQHWLLVSLAALSLLLVLAAITMSIRNKAVQAELVKQQQFVKQSLPISNLNGKLVQGIAQLAVQTGDNALQNILSQQGINIQVNAASSTSKTDGATP